MPTVFASSGDSVVEKSVSTFIGGASWSTNVRGSATTAGNSQDSTLTNYDFGVWNGKFVGRGTANAWKLNRSFFPFDSSGATLSGNTVASADLKVYVDNLGGTSNQEKRIYAVKSAALADSTADYGNVFSSGTTLRTTYGQADISTTAGYHTFTLTSDAITDINSAISAGNTLTIGLLGFYDYGNSDPGTSNETKIQVYYSEDSSGIAGTSNDPKLELTYVVTGFGHKTIGVASANIGKINGVATANVGKVIGVD